MKLGTKLILIAVLPALLVGLTAIVYTLKVQHELEAVLAAATARETKQMLDKLERIIDIGVGACRAYLHGMLVQRELLKSNEKVGSLGDLDVEDLVGESGREWPQLFVGIENSYSDSRLSADLKKDIARFDNMLPELQFEQVLITNRYGMLVAAREEPAARSYWQQRWWREAVSNKLYLGAASTTKDGKVLRLPIAFRIDDERGRLLGVAYVVLRVQNVLPSQETAHAFDRNDPLLAVALLDSHGRIIYATHPDLTKSLLASERVPANSPPRAEPLLVRCHDKGLDRNLFWARLRPTRAGLLKQLGWNLLAVYDEDKVIEPLASGRTFLLLTLLGASLLALLVASLIAWNVGKRVRQLVAAAEAVGRGRTKLELKASGRDELARLSHAFLTMANKLHEAAEERAELNALLIESARQAGAAEIANGVLHNIGNVLNSIEVSASLVAETVTAAPLEKLQKAASLLRDNKDRLDQYLSIDPRGKKLPEYICLVTDQFKERNEQAAAELKSLLKSLAHAKAVVEAQQSHGKLAGAKERVRLSDLVEDALRLNDASFVRHNIQITRDYADDPEVLTEKHKVLQILVNLINNAKQAVGASGRADRRITIGTFTRRNFAAVRVTDNGVGIEPEVLKRVFEAGFTTKDDGHGVGLHFSAIAAKELNGRLTASSEGRGKGATFTLWLPFELSSGAEVDNAQAADKDAEDSKEREAAIA